MSATWQTWSVTHPKMAMAEPVIEGLLYCYTACGAGKWEGPSSLRKIQTGDEARNRARNKRKPTKNALSERGKKQDTSCTTAVAAGPKLAVEWRRSGEPEHSSFRQYPPCSCKGSCPISLVVAL